MRGIRSPDSLSSFSATSASAKERSIKQIEEIAVLRI